VTARRDGIDAYAVLGNPVSHSLSPRIHRSFAEQTQQAISYEAIELAVDDFEAGLIELQKKGMRGANVTVPFKQQAWNICDQLSPGAQQAAAVNTLSFNVDGSIQGDNTDGIGLVRDLTVNLRLSLEQQKILILGAGGAVRGVLGPLLALSPHSITIVNRNLEKARLLARDFADLGELPVSGYDELGGESYDLIINATAAGLSNEIPPVTDNVLDTDSVCYDMVYNRLEPTAFVQWARKRGVTAAYDGLGMLVEQAAESFFIWRGVHTDTSKVIQSLRQV
jgi:shikimate dehydrogenase